MRTADNNNNNNNNNNSKARQTSSHLKIIEHLHRNVSTLGTISNLGGAW